MALNQPKWIQNPHLCNKNKLRKYQQKQEEEEKEKDNKSAVNFFLPPIFALCMIYFHS